MLSDGSDAGFKLAVFESPAGSTASHGFSDLLPVPVGLRRLSLGVRQSQSPSTVLVVPISESSFKFKSVTVTVDCPTGTGKHCGRAKKNPLVLPGQLLPGLAIVTGGDARDYTQ